MGKKAAQRAENARVATEVIAKQQSGVGENVVDENPFFGEQPKEYDDLIKKAQAAAKAKGEADRRRRVATTLAARQPSSSSDLRRR